MCPCRVHFSVAVLSCTTRVQYKLSWDMRTATGHYVLIMCHTYYIYTVHYLCIIYICVDLLYTFSTKCTTTFLNCVRPYLIHTLHGWNLFCCGPVDSSGCSISCAMQTCFWSRWNCPGTSWSQTLSHNSTSEMKNKTPITEKCLVQRKMVDSRK